MSRFGRWGTGRLLAAWVAYWAALAGVTLGPAIRALWSATHLPEPGTGTADLSLGGGALSLVVKEHGAVTYQGTADVLVVCLLIAAGPLVTWAIWLGARGRRRDPVAAEASGGRR